MSTPPALPAPGGNATAAIVPAGTIPEEVAIHSGGPTTEGDMSYVDDPFDPVPTVDPRINMPGVLDMEFNQLYQVNFATVDNRTANVAVVNQGLDPNLAGQLLTAQGDALRTEANALHTEVLDRQREMLVSEARDRITSVEQQAAEEITQRNLQLNEQAAHAMSYQKSAQIQAQSQDQRIKELTAELQQVRSSASQLNQNFQQASLDLQAANAQMGSYVQQIDALNRQTADIQKCADLQRKDFENEIEKLRREQADFIRQMKLPSQEGTPRPSPSIARDAESPKKREDDDLLPNSKITKQGPSSDADNESEQAEPKLPPGLPPGGPPDDPSGSDHGHRGRRSEKERKKSRGRSRRRRRRDPSSSPSSSSSSTESSSESRIARKIRKELRKSQSSNTKAKESDRVIIPKFPQPENYRNWRIRVRDAVIAASSKPDVAFHWIEEVFKTDQTIEALQDSGKFVTLDAKLMSSLTNICDGDFARQLDIFKEAQAKTGTHARGRQALLMIHKHFSTSRKHGAVYDIEDLMAVTLVNDDLRSFITRWDAVIAGMTSEPDVMWKQAYFHNAIKNFKPLSHDLAVYDRTPEGEPNRSYDFLMKAARDYLERKRLEKMR